MMGLLLNGALVAAKPLDAITKDLTGAIYIGVEKVGDADCHHLKMSDAEGEVDLWIGNGDQPLVHKAVVDQSRGLAATGYAGSVIIHIAYTDWRIDQPIDAGAFRFDPPADAKKVKQFGEGARSGLEGKPAPDFTLNALDGKTVKLSDLKGKVVILDFWATWCGPCRMAMPIIDKVARQFAGQGVQLYAVNLRETPDQIKAFLKEQNLSINVLLDSEGKAGNAYQANAIPQTVIIDRDGVVRTVHVGLLPNLEQALTDELKALTAKAQP
jgi:peroxiredoxin